MPIRFYCSSCTAKLSVATRKAGTNCKCPRCSSDIQVPSLTSELTSLPPVAKAPTLKLSRTLLVSSGTFLLGGAFTFASFQLWNIASPSKQLAQTSLLTDSQDSAEKNFDLTLAANSREESSSQAADLRTPTAQNDELPGRSSDDAEISSYTVPSIALSETPAVPVTTDLKQASEATSNEKYAEVTNLANDEVVAKNKKLIATNSEAGHTEAANLAGKEIGKVRAVTLKRTTTEEFEERLHNVPQIGIDRSMDQETSVKIFQLASKKEHPIEEFIHSRSELSGLPFRLGRSCLASRDRVSELQQFGTQVKRYLPSIEQGHIDLTSDRYSMNTSRVIPAIHQVLQAEASGSRTELVKLCSLIESPEAISVLAKRAIFDQSRYVREKALDALKNQDPETYTEILIDGLRYPFSPVVENAAIAIVDLKRTDLIPELRAVLEEPDPTDPQVGVGDERYFVRELVRVNHFSNCTLCHAPSTNASDQARGLVPRYGEPIPVTYYQTNSPNAAFVRADVTYLRQDFSVSEVVEKPGKWPSVQRFDYLVRTRQLKKDEIYNWEKKKNLDANATSKFKIPIIHALRRLHEADYGDQLSAWKENLKPDSSLVREGIEVPKYIGPTTDVNES